MKAMLITVVATTLTVGTSIRAQDLTQDTKHAADKTADVTKDTSKDVAHGTKKGAVKTADVTKDTSKDVAHGTTKAAKKTGHTPEPQSPVNPFGRARDSATLRVINSKQEKSCVSAF
jgi:hypothetical protein